MADEVFNWLSVEFAVIAETSPTRHQHLLGSSLRVVASGEGLAPHPESVIKALQPSIGQMICWPRGGGAAAGFKKRVSTRVN
ncbi:MAG TPA: hypothetical protein EYQ26_02960 [Rhodospirillales bacterium]|nr:hypothetical protein [Rhodospirillales bacterium]